MDGNSLSLLTGLIGCAVAVGGFLFGRKSAHNGEGREMGQLLTQMAEAQRSLQRIEKGLERNDAAIMQINVRLGVLEDRAGRRMDILEGGM